MTSSPRPSCSVGARPRAGHWLLWTPRRPLAGGVAGGCRAAQSPWGPDAQGHAGNLGRHHEGPQEGIPSQNSNQQVLGGRRERQRLALEALGAQENPTGMLGLGLGHYRFEGGSLRPWGYTTQGKGGRRSALDFGGGDMASEGLTEGLPGSVTGGQPWTGGVGDLQLCYILEWCRGLPALRERPKNQGAPNEVLGY